MPFSSSDLLEADDDGLSKLSHRSELHLKELMRAQSRAELINSIEIQKFEH